MEDPVCTFGKVSKLFCELLGLFHRELLAMGMPGGIDQQTNALDIIVGTLTVILLVSIMSPNIVCIGATCSFSHLSMARLH